MTIEMRKYHLVENIIKLSDERLLSQLEEMLHAYQTARQSIRYLAKPMRTTLDIDQLVKEQNFKGVDKSKVDNLIEDMAIETPIEDLLKML